MKKLVYGLSGLISVCFSIQDVRANEPFDLASAIADLKSGSCDLRGLYGQLDVYQKNAPNQEEKFDAQQFLLAVAIKINDEWEGDLIPSRESEFCPGILAQSSNQWHRAFAFIGLAGEYMADRRTRELAIPVLTNAIAQIESIELNPNDLSPVLAYFNGLCVEEDGPDWYKRVFSGMLGEVYVSLERLDEAEEIRKKIVSPHWQKLLGDSIQKRKQVIKVRTD